MTLKKYLVVRTASNRSEPFVEFVSASNKRTLVGYYLDWDSDEPKITYKTLLIKKVGRTKL